MLIYYCTPILTKESNKVSNAIMTKMFKDVRVARRTSLMMWCLGGSGRRRSAAAAEGWSAIIFLSICITTCCDRY